MRRSNFPQLIIIIIIIRMARVLSPHLDLLHGEVEEGEFGADRDDGLGAVAAHGRPEAAVELHDHQLVEHGVELLRRRLLERAVVADL